MVVAHDCSMLVKHSRTRLMAAAPQNPKFLAALEDDHLRQLAAGNLADSFLLHCLRRAQGTHLQGTWRHLSAPARIRIQGVPSFPSSPRPWPSWGSTSWSSSQSSSLARPWLGRLQKGLERQGWSDGRELFEPRSWRLEASGTRSHMTLQQLLGGKWRGGGRTEATKTQSPKPEKPPKAGGSTDWSVVMSHCSPPIMPSMGLSWGLGFRLQGSGFKV